jgi:hypothetical protein
MSSILLLKAQQQLQSKVAVFLLDFVTNLIRVFQLSEFVNFEETTHHIRWVDGALHAQERP